MTIELIRSALGGDPLPKTFDVIMLLLEQLPGSVEERYLLDHLAAAGLDVEAWIASTSPAMEEAYGAAPQGWLHQAAAKIAVVSGPPSPTFTGSEKQVAWAADLHNAAVEWLQSQADAIAAESPLGWQFLAAYARILGGTRSASDWIEARQSLRPRGASEVFSAMERLRRGAPQAARRHIMLRVPSEEAARNILGPKLSAAAPIAQLRGFGELVQLATAAGLELSREARQAVTVAVGRPDGDATVFVRADEAGQVAVLAVDSVGGFEERAELEWRSPREMAAELLGLLPESSPRKAR